MELATLAKHHAQQSLLEGQRLATDVRRAIELESGGADVDKTTTTTTTGGGEGNSTNNNQPQTLARRKSAVDVLEPRLLATERRLSGLEALDVSALLKRLEHSERQVVALEDKARDDAKRWERLEDSEKRINDLERATGAENMEERLQASEDSVLRLSGLVDRLLRQLADGKQGGKEGAGLQTEEQGKELAVDESTNASYGSVLGADDSRRQDKYEEDGEESEDEDDDVLGAAALHEEGEAGTPGGEKKEKQRWFETLDQETGLIYYFNEATNETVWIPPEGDAHEIVEMTGEELVAKNNQHGEGGSEEVKTAI